MLEERQGLMRTYRGFTAETWPWVLLGEGSGTGCLGKKENAEETPRVTRNRRVGGKEEAKTLPSGGGCRHNDQEASVKVALLRTGSSPVGWSIQSQRGTAPGEAGKVSSGKRWQSSFVELKLHALCERKPLEEF